MNPQAHAWRLPLCVREFAAAYTSHRHAILFYSLLMTLASAPIVNLLHFKGWALRLAMAANLVASVLGLERGRTRTALLLLTAAALAARMVPASLVTPGLSAAALVFWSVIALFAAGGAVHFVMRATVIEAEHLYAALSVYLLAGIFFGLLHWTIEQGWPGSYVTAAGGSGPFLLTDGLYFSFVTLATLGYGDVLPRSDIARGLAVLEAVGGQLYLTVMIARLVGSHLQDRNRPTGG